MVQEDRIMGGTQTVICIVGPTATGKTGLSVSLAKQLSGEIISADSMQIYQGFNIGTAKISPCEMGGIPHHMIDVVAPEASFSVAQYCAMVQPIMQDILFRNKTPLLVGGTGLYVDSLLSGQPFEDMEIDPDYRSQLQLKAEEMGNQYLWNCLHAIDPSWAETLHPNNIRRVIRALEIYHLTGKTMTQYSLEQTKDTSYRVKYIGLCYADREKLYDKINVRVDRMIQRGLLQEVEQLIDGGVPSSCQAMQAIGYKELLGVIRGEVSLDEAIEQIKRNSRRYAKRQMTWFKRNEQIHWIFVDEQDPLAEARKILNLC